MIEHQFNYTLLTAIASNRPPSGLNYRKMLVFVTFSCRKLSLRICGYLSNLCLINIIRPHCHRSVGVRSLSAYTHSSELLGALRNSSLLETVTTDVKAELESIDLRPEAAILRLNVY